jgi:hypothetical protein
MSCSCNLNCKKTYVPAPKPITKFAGYMTCLNCVKKGRGSDSVTREKDKVTALGSLHFPRRYHTHSLLAIYQYRNNIVLWWKVTKLISTAGLPFHLPLIPIYGFSDEMPCCILLRFSSFTAIHKILGFFVTR